MWIKKLSFLSAVLLSSCGQPSGDEVRMDRTKLNVGTYILQDYARTEQHIKDVADCGIDFVIGVPADRDLLDLFSKYGIGAVVGGVCPSWWGGDGDNAGKLSERNPMSAYEKAAETFEDHPAIWSVDIGDEPSALDFPYYGQVYEKVKQLFPKQFPYLNLYPNYASVAENTGEQTINQLGTDTYARHISAYCNNVPADYLCYDFYPYSLNEEGISRAYKNLCVVADACTYTGRSMWIVLQVNSNKPEVWTSENRLRFQAYTALAFGAEVITWACYTAGWWTNEVLDRNGEKTRQYDRLKRVNAELHAIGEKYMKYRRVSTSFVGYGAEKWLADANVPALDFYSDGTFSDLKAGDTGPLVVGTMESRSEKGRKAVFICTADDPYDEHNVNRTVTFRADGSKYVSVTAVDGQTVKLSPVNGIYSLSLPSNSAVLVEE